jgi:predicted CxxxxCH...CXXCH cytochrome family protein
VSGVDAFAYSWRGENVWLVPPPKLVLRTVAHCKASKAQGILIIPKWTSAVYWPTICNGCHFISGITMLYEYKNPKNFFVACPFGNNVFSSAAFKGNILILKLDFRRF